jgi:hypothetical protein
MNKNVNEGVKTAIQALYKENTYAEKLFDWFANRSRASRATSIDSIAWNLEISRWEAVALARRLEEAGCGQFKNGRRGSKSRIEWTYNCILLGKAATGEAVSLERTSELDLSDLEDDDEGLDVDEANGTRETVSIGEMIAEAKRKLAERAGLSVSQIEIQIKF